MILDAAWTLSPPQINDDGVLHRVLCAPDGRTMLRLFLHPGATPPVPVRVLSAAHAVEAVVGALVAKTRWQDLAPLRGRAEPTPPRSCGVRGVLSASPPCLPACGAVWPPSPPPPRAWTRPAPPMPPSRQPASPRRCARWGRCPPRRRGPASSMPKTAPSSGARCATGGLFRA